MSFRLRSLLLLLTLLVCTTALHAQKPELITRVFKLPLVYLSGGGPSGGASPAAAADPFAADVPAPPAPVPPLKTAKELLTAQGIDFPEGTSATFNPTTGLLTVTNSQANVDLIADYLDTIFLQSPAIIACTLTVIEGPGELIRQANAAASRTANAAQELTTLLGYAKNPGSNVRVVADAFLETKSGIHATTEAVREHTYASALEMDAKSRSSVAQEMRRIGLVLEWEPTLSSDGTTVDSNVSVELQPAPPGERQVSLTESITGNTAEFPVTDVPGAHFTTGLTSTTGSTKLIGITKPVGTLKQNADILWAAFLTINVRRIEKSPTFSTAAAPSQIVQTPPGLSAAAFNVSDGLFESFMEKPQPLQTWFETKGIIPVKGASATHSNNLLEVINTTDNIERIATLVDECLGVYPKTVAFTLHTIQAPATFLRDLTRQTTSSADDAAMLAAVEAAVTRGEASFINSIFLETKSGTRATHQSACEHVYLSDFGTNAKGLPTLAFEMRPVGSILEIEPTIGADGRTVEITFSHELHPAAPSSRRDHFRDPASNKPFDMPVVDFHSTHTVTGISVTKGSTKLLSLNKPVGRPDSDVLWATFLKCDLVTQVPKPRHTTSEPAKKPQTIVDPKAWNTKMYRVPSGFLSSSGHAEPSTRRTARYILEACGIPFPEGATASYNPASSVMMVKNTNENLALVDAYVESITATAPKTVTFTTHVLQGPGPLLRRLTSQSATKSDHHAELAELLAAVKTGTVQHLDTARIETKSGTRATAEQANEHTAITDITLNDKGEPVFEHEMRRVGLTVELEPTIGADGVTVELTLAPEFHTAPPFEHREHIIDTQGRRLEFPLTDYCASKVVTGITLPDGTARLLSLYKPTGKPEFEKQDILQAIFITCDILRTRE
jgi:hypothetical protein